MNKEFKFEETKLYKSNLFINLPKISTNFTNERHKYIAFENNIEHRLLMNINLEFNNLEKYNKSLP